MEKVKINSIKNIEEIKTIVLNSSQLEIVQSVVNNGQLIAVEIDSNMNLIDGISRVLGCINAGLSEVTAVKVSNHENEQNKAKHQYIVNNHRADTPSAKKADLAIAAIGTSNDNESSEIYMKLGIKTSEDDLKKYNANSKLSKSHISKFKSITKLPEEIKNKINEYEIPINTAYELGKNYKNEEINIDQIKTLVDEVKELSDRKGVAHIQDYIKKHEGGVEISDLTQEISGINFKKTTIIIDITKHFNNPKYTLKDLTDENKKNIKNLIDKVFEYLKNSYFEEEDNKPDSSNEKKSNNEELKQIVDKSNCVVAVES
ncbi:MAG: ParB/RepB/Spo0J family partition protein [Campylobacterota bacterium]|nr:ParB/RepB/Spo0J family partition protein [Campylobacterota bacterium]